MADQNKKQYIKYEDTTYILQDSRIPDPTAEDNGKVLGVVNGEYALKQEEGGGGAVTSVNGKTGAVTITATELGALTEHQSLAAYRTSAAQDTIDTAQDQAIAAKYSKPSGGIPASDLADDMPFFTLPEGGEEGQALVSDGNEGAEWGNPPSSGSGLTEDIKQALLDCFENVAWINDDGQDYYDALYAALYPPADIVSISAVFTQGNYAFYATDSLDSLKSRLVVTGLYTDASMRTITDYMLSGTLAEGTSVVTVTKGGKTTTFNVTVLPDRTPIITNTGVSLNNNGEEQTLSGWCVTDFHETKYANLPFTLVVGSNVESQTTIAKTVTYNSSKTRVNSYDVAGPRELAWPINAVSTPPTYFRTSIKGNGSMGYAYVKETGEIIFAGINSPYYRTITVPSE